MARSYVSLFLFFIIAVVLATPIKPLHKRSFKVNLIRNENYVADGPRALRKAYSKFGLGNLGADALSLKKRNLNFGFSDISFVPNGDIARKISAAASNSTGSEDGETTAVSNENDSQFLSPVTIGGQSIVVDFDSGSSDTWVFNTNLASSVTQGHTVFDPSKSSTFKLLQGNNFNISYGDGSSASGPVGIDTMDVGGATATSQAVGLPDNVSNSFATNTASNGLVGLAFSKLNTVRPQQQKTFFDNIVSQLAQPVFTAQLKSEGTGSYEFGNVDTSSFTGKLQVANVDSSQGFWQFASTSAAVNGKTVSINGGSAIADTGTSLMLVTDDMLQTYYDAVDGATLSEAVGGVIFPCNAQLPDLQVAIGDNMATVSGANFNFAPAGTDQQSGQDFCFGGMQSNQGLGFSIYGDVFFRSNFIVFDSATPSLGFAPHS